MKLTYFGHSAFQIETKGTTLLFDPFISDNPHAAGVVSAEDLDPDYLFLTHAHADHWGDTLSIARRTGAQLVGNFEIVTYAQNEGIENVQPMNTGGAWDFPFGRVFQTYARHSSSFPDGTYGGNPNGYILHLEGKCIYNLGDTSPFAEMAWYGEDHDIDLALMPVGDCFTMNAEGAVRAAGMLNPAQVVPVHYDTFPFIEIDMEACQQTFEDAGFALAPLTPGGTLSL